jgi:protoporphyrinogen oxidase
MAADRHNATGQRWTFDHKHNLSKADIGMRVGIVGGGLMGLSLAQRLSSRGHDVTVFERDSQLGGLATHHNYGEFTWDRFYHVILPSDTHLIGFLRDIGLGEQVNWSKTRTGYYVDKKLHSISNNIEFLKFPLVGLWGKFRLALTILYCSRIKNWRRLEKITVEEWLIKTCGRKTYEKFWKPLLLAKLGESYRRVSAVFIWTYIKRLFSARDNSAQSNECLGHVSGGYKTVFDRLTELIKNPGGEIRTGVAVDQVRPCPDGGITVSHGDESEHFDKVIFTSPVNVLKQAASAELLDIKNGVGEVEYLGVVCGVLVTRKPLVPFYVVNIADSRIPFTGVVGMSNVVAVEETAGYYLTYLPRYVISDDALLRRSDEELRQKFLDGLRQMFPDFEMADIVSMHVNRAFKVQPLQVLNYSTIVPQVKTRHEDFFVLNTSQFVNNTLNNNEVIRAVDDFMHDFGAAFVDPIPRREAPDRLSECLI